MTAPVTMTSADADDLKQFRALIGSPDKLQAMITTRHTALAARAAREAGYNGRVFARLAIADSLRVEYKDLTERINGNNVVTRVAHVRRGDAVAVPLEQFVDAEMSDFRAALEAPEDDDDTVDDLPFADGEGAAGVEYPRQKPGDRRVRRGSTHDELVERARATGEYNPT